MGLRSAVVGAFVILAAAVEPATAHPLHTSMAEVAFDSRRGTISVALRVFIDDFRTASLNRRQSLVAGRMKAAAPNPLVDYALATFQVLDRNRRPIPLESCGGKKVGDLLWLCFRGKVDTRSKGLHVLSQVLFDLYADQINIVKATVDGKSSSMLFTVGGQPKPLS